MAGVSGDGSSGPVHRRKQDGEVLSLKAVDASGLGFEYETGHEVLHSVDLRVSFASSVAILGPSGSGKSTLLHCLAGLLPLDRGRVVFVGEDLAGLSEEALLKHRRSTAGFVFQEHLLLDDLPIVENVALPLMLNAMSRRDATARAQEQLDVLDIGHLGDCYPSHVSRGERQRASVARALVHRPRVIFADEPTGSLDRSNGKIVAASLVEGSREREAALLLATHDLELASRCDRVLLLESGQLTRDSS